MTLLGLSAHTWDILLSSWADGTALTYEGVAKRWLGYTSLRDVNPISPDIYHCLDFLTQYFDTGVGHSAINTSRSFLSCFITIGGTPLGEHPLMTKFVRGTKRKRPPGGKIKTIWDPAPVLGTLKAWGNIPSLSFERLTRRTMVLFLLATGQRLQALHKLLRGDCQWGEGTLKVTYSTKLKSNDPIANPLILNFLKHQEEELCIYSHLKAYETDPRSLKAAPYMFATVKQPGLRASAATISRMVKSTLTMTGVDEQFTAYTARHASTSAADRMNVPLGTILAAAGWANESTFARFYKRPVHVDQVEIETDFIPHIVGT